MALEEEGVEFFPYTGSSCDLMHSVNNLSEKLRKDTLKCCPKDQRETVVYTLFNIFRILSLIFRSQMKSKKKYINCQMLKYYQMIN